MPFSTTNIAAGGSAGLQHTTDAGLDMTAAAEVISTLTVPSPGWYDVDVVLWASVTGAIADAQIIGLYSDPVTSGTPVLQRVVPFNPFTPTAAAAGLVPIRTRVYAQSTITTTTLAAASATTTKIVSSLTVAPVTEWNTGV